MINQLCPPFFPQTLEGLNFLSLLCPSGTSRGQNEIKQTIADFFNNKDTAIEYVLNELFNDMI